MCACSTLTQFEVCSCHHVTTISPNLTLLSCVEMLVILWGQRLTVMRGRKTELMDCDLSRCLNYIRMNEMMWVCWVFVAWLNCFMAAQGSKAFENHNIPIMIKFITPEYMEKKKLLSVLETWKLSLKSLFLFFLITECVNWAVTERNKRVRLWNTVCCLWVT